jgi:TRAP-type C4-dicarboxylate transport system substrate-binding protein
MRNTVSLIAATALTTASLSTAALAENINFNVWVPPSEIIVSDGFIPYFDAVTKETDGAVTVQLFTAGQMMGPLDTMPAVRDGAVQGGMVDAVYYSKDMNYAAMFGDLVAFSPNAVAAAGASAETFFQDCPECIEDFTENNMIALGGTSSAPYTVMCSTEITSLDDLKGLRVRGSIDYHFALIEALGANGVNVPFSEIAQSFERGNVDCLLGGPTWLRAFGITELIKSRLSTVSFGTINVPGQLAFQKSAWDSWSDEVHASMIKNAPIMIANATIEVLKDNDESAALAHEAGMKEIDLGADLEALRDSFLVSERVRLIAAGEARGAEHTERVLDAYLANYAIWEELTAEIGDDKEKFAEVLWERIYSKLDM